MNTGRIPGRGYDVAVMVARDLGQLMFFTPSPKYPADFMIRGDEYLGLIAIRRTRRIRAVIAEIMVRYAMAISGVRTFPAGGPVSRELWLYSRYGTVRFFRVTGIGIEEIDRRVILFPEKIPERPVENPAATGAAGPAPISARLAAEDDDRSLLRWLARRCPEISGETAPEISAKKIARDTIEKETPGAIVPENSGRDPAQVPVCESTDKIPENDPEIPGKIFVQEKPGAISFDRLH